MALLYCRSIEKGLAKWFRVEWRGERGKDISFRQEEEEWGKPPPFPIFKSDSQRERLVGGWQSGKIWGWQHSLGGGGGGGRE